MSYEQFTYIGPYLRLYFKPGKIKDEFLVCPNRHKGFSVTAKFCPKCGSQLIMDSRERPAKLGFEDFLDDHPELMHDDIRMYFTVVPHEGNSYQTLIANHNGPGREFCQRDYEHQMDEDDFDQMLADLWNDHGDMITKMGEWSRVDVKFGVIGFRW